MGRILIIEDEPDIADMYKWILELDGHEVLGVFNAPHLAINPPISPSPDIIILDERLSGGSSGTEHLPDLRRCFPDARIIIATADPRVVADKHALGVQEALLKPFSLEHLASNVGALVAPHTAGLAKHSEKS